MPVDLMGVLAQICFAGVPAKQRKAAVGEYFQYSMETGKMHNLDPSMRSAALGMTLMIHPESSRLVR